MKPETKSQRRREMEEIYTKAEMKKLAKKLKVRDDWHEPDEQEVDVRIAGYHFDNAGTPNEIQVIFFQNGCAVAQINLATLCSFACYTCE